MTCPFRPPRQEPCVDAIECNSCKRLGHKRWCASLSDGHDDPGCTCGAIKRFTVKPRRVDLWNTPTTSSGKFESAKRSGDVLHGARREDSYSFWDSFDALHKSLLTLLAIATSGLILHALGVFC